VKKTKERRTQARRKRRHTRLLRFDQLKGKTVEFIEISADADFPCVEIGFDDKTALLVLMNAQLTMEPEYSKWHTGNQRLLRRWPALNCT